MTAMTVPGNQRSPHRWGDDAGGAADVDWFGVGAEDDPVDDGVTGGSPHLIGSQDLSVGGFVDPTTLAGEGVEVSQDQDMRLLRPGRMTRVQEGAGQINEGIGASLPGRPQVAVAAGWGRCL
jgi:hypothetical protein